MTKFQAIEFIGIVPIHINMKYLPKSKERLIGSTIQFIQRNILDDESISKHEITDLISLGKIVFLIDNVKTNDSNHTKWIKKFIETYSNNRFILTIKEEFFQSLDVKHISDYGTTFKERYIYNIWENHRFRRIYSF